MNRLTRKPVLGVSDKGRHKLSLVMRKPAFCICENKDTDQLPGNHEADQSLCFRYIVQFLYFLNSKFQTSSHLLWLYSLVCVGPGRKAERWFSHDAAQMCLKPLRAGILIHRGSYMRPHVLSLVVRKPVFGVSHQV